MTSYDSYLDESATLATASSNTKPDSPERQSWSSGKAMPTPRNEVSGAILERMIYTIGGFDIAGNTTDIVEAYDTRGDRWTTSSSLPQPLDHVAAAADGHKLYVVGGYIDENGKRKASDKLFIYDPISGKWKEGAPMPSPRGALTAGFIDGILYAVGGDHDWESWSTNYAYDPSADNWTEKAPMPTARHHLSSAVVDSKLYAIGGRYSNTSYIANLDANEVYDPKSNTWTSLQPMPIKRSGLAAAASSTVSGDIYVFGGELAFTSDKIYDITEKYDPETNKWIAEQPMPTARHGFAVVSMDNRIYLIGGDPNPGHSVSGINEIFVVALSTGVSKLK
jgi:N-acetylneuraminic acid mutarotase